MAANSDGFVALGDVISLFCVDSKGYVFSSNVSDVVSGIYMHSEQSFDKPDGIFDSNMYQFRICIQNRYKLTKKYKKLKDRTEGSDDPDYQQQLKLAKAAADSEHTDNASEMERLVNKKLVYGEIVQFQHLWSGKYVHINTVTGSIKDQDNMLVFLSEANSKSCQFRISPRYKVKSDGDTIQPMDHIKFESVKMPGHYLHASKPYQINKFSFGSELNIGVQCSGFIMSISYRPQPGQKEMLKFGDSIQLYHREMESHLTLKAGYHETPGKDALYFQKKPFSTNSLRLLSSSGCHYWSVENAENVLTAGPVQWGKPVLLRHRITHRYLCLDESLSVTTTAVSHDPRAVFAFNPVSQGGDFVLQYALGRIRHLVTGHWLRTVSTERSDRDDLAVRTDDEDEQIVNNTLSATAEEQYPDAFVFLTVPSDGVLRFNYVAGLVPFFATFNDELFQRGVMRQTEKNVLVLILSELQEYMTVNGEPSEPMQTLLRNFTVVDQLLDLMKLKPPKNPAARIMIYDVMLASYTVVRASLSGNRENAQYLFKDVKFFFEHLENQNPLVATQAALTLKAVMTDNRLVLDELEDRNILYLVDLVRRNRNHLHLDILGAMGVCQERGVAKNQLFAVENLVNSSQECLYRFAFGIECDQKDQDEVYISSPDGKWEKFTHFVKSGTREDREHEFLFLVKQLSLMERLGFGRNTAVIKILLKEKKLINWKIMFECTKNPALPGEIRALFCRLIVGLCILDGTSVLATDMLSLSFEFDTVGRSDAIQRKDTSTTEGNGEGVKMQALQPLRGWVVCFLETHSVIIRSNHAFNQLLAEVVRLADAMLKYGYFGGRADLQQLISAVVPLLDGETDLPCELERTKKGAFTKRSLEILSEFQQTERFIQCPQNASMIKVKLECMKILETVFSYQYHSTLSTLLHKFKNAHSHSWLQKQKLGESLTRTVQLDNPMDAELNRLLEEKLDDIFYRANFFQVKTLTNILFDIAAYEHNEMMMLSTGLLNLLYSSDEQLFKQAADCQVLVTEESRKVYQAAQEQVPMMRILTTGALDDRGAKRVSRAMHQITKSCCFIEDLDLAHVINQKIYINHGTLSILFDLLSQYADVDLRRQSRAVIKCLRRALILLATLCSGQPAAQRRAYEKLDLLLKLKALSSDVGLCLEKIFSGNESLCLALSNERINEIVKFAGSRREKAASVIRALKHMIHIEADKLIIPRNQDIVMKAIMHDFHNVAYVLDKPRDVKMKILNGQYGSEHLDYLLELVRLLAAVAEGENILIESLCQKYITLDEIMSILNNDTIIWHLKSPYLRFLDSAYMNTISSPQQTGASELAHASATWEFMERIAKLLDSLSQALNKRKGIIDPLLGQHVSVRSIDPDDSYLADQNDGTEKFQFDLKVFFFGVIPFLERFMASFFEQDEVNFPDEIKIIDKLAKKTLELAEFARPCLFNDQYMKTMVSGVTCLAAHSSLPQEDVRDFLTKVRNMKSLQTGAYTSVKIDEYDRYYKVENQVNECLSVFNKNLLTVYGGPNTVQGQLGPYLDRKIPKDLRDKEYSIEGPEQLPLGPEFQQFVLIHVNREAKTVEERYKRATRLIDFMKIGYEFIGGGLSNPSSRSESLGDEEKKRLDEINLKCLQILRTIIYNEILFLPENQENAQAELAKIRDIQNMFVNHGLFPKILWLVGCENPEVSMEVMTFSSSMFFNANKDTQSAFYTYFCSTSEEMFFAMADELLDHAKFQIREIRTLHLQKMRQKNAVQESTLADFLYQQIKLFSPNLKVANPVPEQKKIPWWYSKKKKKAILQQRQMSNGTDETEMMAFSNPAYSEGKEESIYQEEPDYSVVLGKVSQVLVLMAESCDGQNEQMQDYMRNQPDNVKSFNLVASVGRFLASIYTTVGPNTIGLITQILVTMNELASGNQPNQASIQQSKIVDQINYILRSGVLNQCGEDGVEFLESLICLLRTMTEENDPDTIERTKAMAESLDYTYIVKMLTECYRVVLPDGTYNIPPSEYMDTTPLLPELIKREKHVIERLKSLGFDAFFFMKRFMEHSKKCRVEDLSTESRIAWNYYQRKSTSIELVKEDYVNRVYFRVENREILRPDVIEHIRWDIDRTSYCNKIRDLMSWRRGVLQDMKFQRKVMGNSFARLLLKLWFFLVYFNLFITVTLVGFLMHDYEAPLTVDQIANLSDLAVLPPELFGTGDEPLSFTMAFQPGSKTQWHIEVTFQLLHNLTSILIAICYFLRNQPVFPDVRGFIESVKKRFERPVLGEIKSDEQDQVESKSLGTPIFGFTTLYYIIFLGCSISGLLVSPFFFSFHLFNIISINQILKRVIRAVTQNGVSLLWVTVLGLAVIFVYTLIIFVSFRSAMDPAENWYCDRIYKCFVTIVRYGLIGEFFENMVIPDQDKTFPRFAMYALLHLSFFILITTIGLNIVFGIIVDTFSELRDLKWTAEKDMNEVCTICDIEAYEFDNKAKGFWHHVTKEHCMWDYLFYFLYLSETSKSDLTSIELYIYNQLEKKQTDFFPNNKALSLINTDQKDDDKLDRILKQVKALTDRQNARDNEDRRRREEERRRNWEQENRPIYDANNGHVPRN